MYGVESRVVVGAVRVLAEGDGSDPAKSACLWINSLGWTTVVPDWSEITAAPMEILHGAWAGVQEKRKFPPRVVPAGEPSAPEKVA